MELGQIYVRTNLWNWPKNSQQTRTKSLSAVQMVTSMGISIVSLWNDDFLTLHLCLTMGQHLGFTEKLRNSRSRRLFANSSWGNAATAFLLLSQFHICGCVWYKLYSGKRCILGEGKRLGGKTVGLQYPVWLLHNIDSNIKTLALSQWSIEYEARSLPWGLPCHGLAPSKHLRCMPDDGRSATFKRAGNSYVATVNLRAISSSVILCNFYTHFYAYQLMPVCMPPLSAVRLTAESEAVHSIRLSLSIGIWFTMSEAMTRSMHCPSIMISTRSVIVDVPS